MVKNLQLQVGFGKKRCSNEGSTFSSNFLPTDLETQSGDTQRMIHSGHCSVNLKNDQNHKIVAMSEIIIELGSLEINNPDQV